MCNPSILSNWAFNAQEVVISKLVLFATVVHSKLATLQSTNSSWLTSLYFLILLKTI